MAKRHKALHSTHPIFTENKWGNQLNSGKHYLRPYCKTTMSGTEYQKSIQKGK